MNAESRASNAPRNKEDSSSNNPSTSNPSPITLTTIE